jgi:hypothetical protein
VKTVKFPIGQSPIRIEVVDDNMAHVFRAKSGGERLRIASLMYSNARRMMISHLRHEHGDWNELRIQREAARRLSHGAI